MHRAEGDHPTSKFVGRRIRFSLGLYQIVTWLPGALEMDGPYQRKLWAPGVIYRETTIVQRVTQKLAAARLPAMSSDDIVRASVIVQFSMGTLGLAVRRADKSDGSSVHDGLIDMALRQIRQEFPDVRDAARRILATTIIDYRQELATQVAQVYPWKRPKQPLHQREEVNPE